MKRTRLAGVASPGGASSPPLTSSLPPPLLPQAAQTIAPKSSRRIMGADRTPEAPAVGYFPPVGARRLFSYPLSLAVVVAALIAATGGWIAWWNYRSGLENTRMLADELFSRVARQTAVSTE